MSGHTTRISYDEHAFRSTFEDLYRRTESPSYSTFATTVWKADTSKPFNTIETHTAKIFRGDYHSAPSSKFIRQIALGLLGAWPERFSRGDVEDLFKAAGLEPVEFEHFWHYVTNSEVDEETEA